jgi:GMP synthase (glutamine-hydrolysing)
LNAFVPLSSSAAFHSANGELPDSPLYHDRMSIIVFQHGPEVLPGRLGVTLRDHGFKLDIRRLDLLGAKGVPPDFDNVQGVISLGGEQNVGESHPWMQPEIDYLKAAHEKQLAVIGVCLGHQLLAHALGGKVGPMDKPEWGFHNLGINPGGQTDTILSGIAWDSMQFQAHGQEVKELPPGAALLAGSKQCKVQAFRAGIRTMGFQYHFECDRAMIESWAKTSSAMRAAGLSQSDIVGQLDRHYNEFARLADRLCLNIATYVFPLERKW